MAHPSRAAHAESLPFDVVWDRGLGLWDTARRAWLRATGDYHCVIQDDAVLCSDFTERLSGLLRGDVECLSLYIGRRRNVRHLFAPGFTRLDNLFWGVGVVLAAKHIEPMVAYGDSSPLNMDDVVINNFCLRERIPVWYHWPCLVDHKHLKSLANNSNGRRPALCFWG